MPSKGTEGKEEQQLPPRERRGTSSIILAAERWLSSRALAQQRPPEEISDGRLVVSCHLRDNRGPHLHRICLFPTTLMFEGIFLLAPSRFYYVRSWYDGKQQ